MDTEQIIETPENTDESALKIGRMLSAQNADDIASATATIEDGLSRIKQVLQRAGIEVSAKAATPDDLTLALGTDKLLGIGGAVKMLGETRVGGYLIVWGNPSQKDLQGEYFTPQTDLGLDWYKERPTLYHHGLDGTLQTTPIGTIDTLKADDVGLWAEAQLDARNRYVAAVRKLIEKGALGWSSGSLPHLVEIESDGRIKRWVVVEGSLTPTPAEPRIVVTTLKALPVLPLEELPAREAYTEHAASDKAKPEFKFKQRTKGMNIQEMIASVLDALLAAFGDGAPQIDDNQKQQLIANVAAQMEGATDMATMKPEEQKAAGKQIADAVVKALQDFTAPHNVQAAALESVKAAAASATAQSRVPAGVQAQNAPAAKGADIRVISKYDALNEQDMSYLFAIAKNPKTEIHLGDEFYKALADKAIKAHNSSTIQLAPNAFKAVMGIKANELNHSTQAGFGDEWVPDLWSNQVWERMRLENVVASQIKFWDMPSNPYELPIESTDPTVNFVPETTAESELLLSGAGSVIPDSKVATGKAQLTAKKLALRVGISAELEEDSIIPVIPHLRDQAQRAVLDAIDCVILNGDTETGGTGNINSDDAALGSTSKFLAMNGMRRLALVTATGQAVNGGGAAPTLAAFRSARAKLLNAYGMSPQGLMWVVDYSTYIKMLNMSEFLTIDKAGALATAQKGVLGFIDGIPVAVSNEMALTEADGKVNTASPSATLFGQGVLFAKYGWNGGYRRRVKVDVTFLPYYDSYQLTATVRFALTNRDNVGTAVLYNLAV